jgi:uncharacterized protein YidB (DUF937 family)
MGLLDQITGHLAGQLRGGNAEQNPLISMAVGLLQNQQGGLSGLLQQFQSAGLGNQAASWVSTGKNLPISADQIMHALGQGQVQQLAQKAGLKPEAAAGGLADLLPQIVDKLTPNGQVESGSMQDQLAGLLKSLSK